MSQYKAIPQPNDQRNVSQNDILTNYAYLNNANGAAASGIIPVDHLSTGDNVAVPKNGFHNQVSFINRATPASLTNSVNGQNSDSITYAKADGASQSQIWNKNGSIDAPITYMKAFVLFTGGAVIQGQTFNVNNAPGGVVRVSAGVFRVNFSVALPTTNYIVMINSESNSNPPTPTSCVTYTKTTTDVTVIFQNTATTNVRDPQRASVMVIGIF
jgi:hypothetical protein